MSPRRDVVAPSMTSDGETSGATAGRRTDGKRVPGTAHELRCVQAQLGAATTGDCRIYRKRASRPTWTWSQAGFLT